MTWTVSSNAAGIGADPLDIFEQMLMRKTEMIKGP